MTAEIDTPKDEKPAQDSLAGVPVALAQAMRKRGYSELTPVQRAVLDSESDGRDLRISSQTGSGKTVAIGLGLAGHFSARLADKATARSGPSVLVLVPTRELAMQVRDELHWLFAGMQGLRTQVVMGGTSVLVERRGLSQKPHIVVGTPGRTLDHIKGGALVPTEIQHVALDESDRMLDMGFRDELEAILEQLPRERRTHLISATFPGAVCKLADRFQKKPLHIQGTRLGAANADIEHSAHLLDRRESYGALVNLLLLNDDGRCLIFVERRVDASSLATKLSGDGFPVQPFSGELPQAQRTRTLNAFRDGTIRTLVSTDVAARGIDVPDIELVVHMDAPADADSYVHRSGRTGRAGRTGKSVMLVPPRSQRSIDRLLAAARIKAEWTPPPTAAKVTKQLRKRFRHQMHQRLADTESVTQAQIDYAKGLLDGRDPAAVVAMLLEFAEPSPVRAPMEIREPRAGSAPSGKRSDSGGKRSDSRGKWSDSGSKRSDSGFVRFSINWGEGTGATPSRILGHVCRRGDVNSRSVGAIKIGDTTSTFDVEASAAAVFEKRARRPDARDPKLKIFRSSAASGQTTKPVPRVDALATERPKPGTKHRSKAKSGFKPASKGKTGPKTRKPFDSKRKGRA
ncbi:MAG TPA: DEAD/DEAH box helicase [Myxococcales bacterium]|nr:DEAD/DEAH box helicase [Myxococcales bacterium]